MVARRERGGLAAVGHAKLAENAGDVVFDSALAEEEVGADFSVGLALRTVTRELLVRGRSGLPGYRALEAASWQLPRCAQFVQIGRRARCGLSAQDGQHRQRFGHGLLGRQRLASRHRCLRSRVAKGGPGNGRRHDRGAPAPAAAARSQCVGKGLSRAQHPRCRLGMSAHRGEPPHGHQLADQISRGPVRPGFRRSGGGGLSRRPAWQPPRRVGGAGRDSRRDAALAEPV